MQGYSTAYLHLMRAFARTRHAETFAFSTSLTRLTPALAHRSAEAARGAGRASRWSTGSAAPTSPAACASCSRSRHGNVVRGGVLVIASDGWDSDPPEELAAVMAKAAAAGPGGWSG